MIPALRAIATEERSEAGQFRNRVLDVPGRDFGRANLYTCPTSPALPSVDFRFIREDRHRTFGRLLVHLT